MHIFLSGEIQIGKTTALNRALDEIQRKIRTSGTWGHWPLKIGGFRTFTVPGTRPGLWDIHMLSPRQTAADCCRENRVAQKDLSRPGPLAFSQAFDRVGGGLLARSSGCDVILMDELGFLESRAYGFQKAVLEALEGETPVLGVIKPRRSPFLDLVRSHPKVAVWMVGQENRRQLSTLMAGETLRALADAGKADQINLSF